MTKLWVIERRSKYSKKWYIVPGGMLSSTDKHRLNEMTQWLNDKTDKYVYRIRAYYPLPEFKGF